MELTSARAGGRLWETETPLEGLAYKLTHSKSQHRGSSLKSTWVIQEDSLTNVMVYVMDLVELSPGTKALASAVFFFLLPSWPGAGGTMSVTSPST